MSLTIKDDRKPEQKTTHVLAVVARDTFMSGWGGAEGGASRVAWSFDPNKVNSDRVFNWVKARPEMRAVSLVEIDRYSPPKDTAHLQIHAIGPEHRAAHF